LPAHFESLKDVEPYLRVTTPFDGVVNRVFQPVS
jgi:hypothetical protein